MKIIHLSDFHLNKEILASNHKRILDALIKDMEQFEIGDDSILIFSGDFLNCGGKNMNSLEENNFNIFKRLVFDPIYEKFPNLKNRTFFCAGNHDIDRSAIKTIHKVIKESLIRDEKNRQQIYKELRKDNIVGFEKYNEFVSEFYINFKGNKDISNLESNFSFNLNEYKVGISSLNSSFLCYDDNDRGNILIFEEQIKESIELIGECDVKIAILHHPISFLHESESEKIEELLQKEYDLVFLGHTHKQKEFYYQTLIGSCFFSIGKSLNGEEDEKIDYTNGYSILEYTPNQKIRAILRKYNHLGEKFIPNSDYGDENGIFEIDINKNINNKKEKTLEISDDFKIFLNDAGVDFTHKYREKVTLKDIYIFPNLESFNTPDSSEEEIKTTIKSQELLNNINNFKPNRIVILGDKSSGKTSFCKVCFQKIFEKENFYPIFIQGEEIKDLKRIEKLKNRLLNEQYSSSKIPISKKAFLIIDDFNNTKIRPEYLKKFLKDLIESDFSFILIWDEYLTLNDIFDSLISKMDVYEILPFGRKDRYDLIKKWLDLNDIGKNKVSIPYGIEKIINQVIGKNLVPSYPFYILIILQTTELIPNEDFQESTLGHYYDVLIKASLIKNTPLNKEIEKFESYLSTLSYFFYKNRKEELSEDEFIKFHDNYKKVYGIGNDFGFKKTIENLLNSNIIYEINEVYRFRYNYVYYYFLGKYLADNITRDENIKKEITHIAKTLYYTSSANTYLFLSHHSKSEFVIKTILDIAGDIFPKEKMINFSDDIAEINSLVTDTSEKLILDISTSYEENKTNELEQYDNEVIDIKEEENFNEIDFISNINKSFKTIEILGLILKNKYASLIATEKISIARELYSLGLRVISTIFRLLLQDRNSIKEDLIQLIGNDNTYTKSEKEQLAKRIILNMHYMTAYTIIKRISNSVATKDLEITFNSIKEEMINNYAVQLIDISNRFEYSSNFPFEKVNHLVELFKNNKFSQFLLKRFAFNYLRMFPMIDSDRQKVCDKLGIPINQQRQAQITSKTLKK